MRQQSDSDAPGCRCRMLVPGCERLCDLPDKYPLISLSSVLNCWRYLSLEACGMAQSFVPIFGELLASDVVEEEFELRRRETLLRNRVEMTQRLVSLQTPCCSSLFLYLQRKLQQAFTHTHTP